MEFPGRNGRGRSPSRWQVPALGCAALCLAGLAGPAAVAAQPVLKATGGAAAESVAAGALTLRPAVGLEALARKVASVLELRSGRRVFVGDEPPPVVLEAVPAGHVALAESPGGVRVVLGAASGAYFDATVGVSGNGSPDARALALAVEALRDRAAEPSPADEPQAPLDALETPERPHGARTEPRRDVHLHETGGRGLLRGVSPLVYARMYGGASTVSSAPMTGVGVGAGLCVDRQCLVIAGDVPLLVADGEPTDLRYRYVTLSSSFYSRPLSFGDFTPGASLGLVTRIGYFGRDMGIDDDSLDTDLGVRGSLELAWEAATGLDLMTEGGLDLTIDRHELNGSRMVPRGDRWSPWLQGALRYRP